MRRHDTRSGMRRTFWGLLAGLGLMAAGAALFGTPAFERDLREQALSALKASGQTWARVEIRGRDAVLMGEAPSRRAVALARDALRKVKGIRLVRADRVRPAPFATSATDPASPAGVPHDVAGDGPPVRADSAPPEPPVLNRVIVQEGERPVLTGTLPANVKNMRIIIAARSYELGAEGSPLTRVDGQWRLALPEPLPVGAYDALMEAVDETGNVVRYVWPSAVVVRVAPKRKPEAPPITTSQSGDGMTPKPKPGGAPVLAPPPAVRAAPKPKPGGAPVLTPPPAVRAAPKPKPGAAPVLVPPPAVRAAPKPKAGTAPVLTPPPAVRAAPKPGAAPVLTPPPAVRAALKSKPGAAPTSVTRKPRGKSLPASRPQPKAQPSAVARPEPEPTSGPDVAACQQRIDAWLKKNPVRFTDYGEWLLPGGRRAVTGLAAIMKKCPRLKFRIIGYADRIRAGKICATLSRGRAEAVKRALVAQGMEANRFFTEGVDEKGVRGDYCSRNTQGGWIRVVVMKP